MSMPPGARSRLLTLVFTDLVGSSALKLRHGDAMAGQIIQRHVQIVRELLAACEGRLVVSAGDGFFLSFDTPTQGVEFALRLQEIHYYDSALPKLRVGIHTGEVSERYDPTDTRQTLRIDGFAVDLASRFQTLAMAGQTLLSYTTFDNARQRLNNALFRTSVSWRSHGRYLFRGFERPIAVFEAGFQGYSPLVPPPDNDRAQRAADEESGVETRWRPAPGVEVPGRANWVLERLVGTGGFGEVWTAIQTKTNERRVLKFCSSHEHLRALKREVTLFRLMKEMLGDRSDIVRLMDWQFEEAPYYIEMEYVEGLTLDKWLEAEGADGVEGGVPLAVRIQLIVQVADAIAAAHSLGVLHKDIKPSNILVSGAPSGQPRARLLDFGIGVVANRELLGPTSITNSAVEELEAGRTTARQGTTIYMAPEVLEGKPATTAADVYSLGVLLYQTVIGDYGRALAPGWQRDVHDDLLREDIAAAVDGQVQSRLASAAELADRLRQLDQRRTRRDEEEQLRAAAERARILSEGHRQRVQVAWLGAGLGLLIIALLALFGVRERQRSEQMETLLESAEEARAAALRQSRRAEEAQARAEEEQYFASVRVASYLTQEGRLERARTVLFDFTPEHLREWEWGAVLFRTAPEGMTLMREENPNEILHASYSPDGRFVVTGDTQGRAIVWNARTGEEVRRLTLHDSNIWTVRFSPNGQSLLTASRDRTAQLTDLDTGTTIAVLAGHDHMLRGARFSPDGRKIATASHDESVRIWDAETGQLLRSIAMPSLAYDVAFSPDGQTLAVGLLNRSCVLVDPATGALRDTLDHPAGNVLSTHFDGRGRLLIGCTDRVVRLYDAGSTEVLREFTHPEHYVHCAAFSPNGRIAATSDDGGHCFIWDVETGEQLGRLTAEPQMYKVEFSPDGQHLLTTSRRAVKVWDVERLLRQSQRTVAHTPVTGLGVIRTLGMPIPARDSAWREWDREWTAHGQIWTVSDGETSVAVTSCYAVVHPSGERALEMTPGSLRARVVDLARGDTVTDFGDLDVYDGAFNETGTRLAVAQATATIRIYETSRYDEILSLTRARSTPHVLRFAPDGGRLAAGYGDGSVVLWNLTTGEPEWQVKPHQGAITAMDWCPRADLIAAASRDHRASLLKPATGEAHVFLDGHVQRLTSIGFIAGCDRIFTASRDGTVLLWDSADGREVLTAYRAETEGDILGAGLTGPGGPIGVATRRGTVEFVYALPWEAAVYAAEPGATVVEQMDNWKRKQYRRQHEP